MLVKSALHCTGNSVQSGIDPHTVGSENFSLCNPQKTSIQHIPTMTSHSATGAMLWRWIGA